jgi:adenylate cyclase
LGIQDEVKDGIDDICTVAWNMRDGTVIPEAEDVAMRNGAVKVDATWLYADLAASSNLAQRVDRRVAARVIRSYVNAASRIIRHHNGAIRSYDGDRVMGIFIGSSKNNDATRAALGINWAVWKVLDPKLKSQWPSLSAKWALKHGVGIATGEAIIVRGGVPNYNDLISVGGAPNIAAKLSDLRKSASLYVTSQVHARITGKSKLNSAGGDMWSFNTTIDVGGTNVKVYSSTWMRAPGG